MPPYGKTCRAAGEQSFALSPFRILLAKLDSENPLSAWYPQVLGYLPFQFYE